MQYQPNEPRVQAHERVFGRMRSTSGDGRHSMLATVLALSVFIGTGAFGFWQATEPSRVLDQFEHGIAELTDVDTYLATTLPDLRAEAVSSNAGAFQLEGFPIPVTLTRSELLDNEDEVIRDLVLERSASVLYFDGIAAFDRTGSQDLGLLTSEWFLDRVIGVLSGDWHSRAQFVAVVAFLVAAVAATLIFIRRPPAAGLRSVGFAMLAGGVPGLVFTAAGAYWFSREGGGDVFVRSIAAILEVFFLVPRRDYLVVTSMGALFAAAGYALPVIDNLVARARSDTPGPEPDYSPAPPVVIQAPPEEEPVGRGGDSQGSPG